MNNIQKLFLIFYLISGPLFAQVAINTDGSSADNSAILDVKSSDKGVLFPRLSQSQISNISNPANGLIVFCSGDGKFYVFISAEGIWKEIANGSTVLNPDSQSCDGTPTVSYQGQVYNTVNIGGLCWFKENLNVGNFINSSQEMVDNGTIEKYCYNNIESNCDTYGGLYKWDELMQYTETEKSQGICPEGWHIPSDFEMKFLEVSLGMTENEANSTNFRGTNEGYKMKSTNGWDDGGNGSNESGINALPSGYYSYSGVFVNINQTFHLYSSTKISENIWYRALYYGNSRVYRNSSSVSSAMAVRCVKD